MVINKINWGKQLRSTVRKSRQTAVGLIVLAGIGVAIAIVPAYSQTTPSPLKLAQQGKEYYAAGQLDRAIETWQQAAVAYETAKNESGSRESYLNKATAQQALGLYNRSCDSLLLAFDLENQIGCSQIIEDAQTIESQLEQDIALSPEAQSKLLPGIAAIESQPDGTDKVQGLLRFGDYLRASGYPRVANRALELGLASTKQAGDTSQQTAALLSLGNAQRAIAIQQQNKFSTQTTVLDVVANSDGSVESALAVYQPALNYYQQAAQIAPEELDSTKAQLNRLSLLLDVREFWQGAITEFNDNLDILEISDRDFLQQVSDGAVTLQQNLEGQLQGQIGQAIAEIEPDISQLPPTRGGIYSRINLAQSLMRNDKRDRDTAQILATAIEQAESIGNKTAQAEAMGYLGSLYQQQEQYVEAQRLTENSLQLATTAEHPEIAYRWNAQLGEILAARGNRDRALSAYETSFNTIRSLRSDLATTPVEPIFRKYISLLLQSEPTTDQLAQARDVLESLQIVTLDNFFRDPCSEVSEEPVAIDDVDSEAAVIYPILLQDRLEVILTLPGKPLRRYTTRNLTPTEVKNTIQQLRRSALTNPGFAEQIRGVRGNPQAAQTITQLKSSLDRSLEDNILPPAAKLYSWLVKPAEAEIEASKVKTLVFVLDGSLRNIPMSLLYDP